MSFPQKSDNLGVCEKCGFRHDNLLCATAPELWRLLDHVTQRSTFKPNQVIFYQGNEPLGLYTVTSGSVKLEFTSDEGQCHTLRYSGPGSALGYRALFARDRYQATAITMEITEVCFVPKHTIMEIFARYPELTFKIVEALSRDLKISEQKWIAQMDKDASERVAEALLFLQEHFEHLNWTRKEIAEWAGTTPETVIRTLAQFEKEGYIDQSQSRKIRLLDKKKLLDKLYPTQK